MLMLLDLGERGRKLTSQSGGATFASLGANNLEFRKGYFAGQLVMRMRTNPMCAKQTWGLTAAQCTQHGLEV
jgi:hypothetical protein